VDLTKTQKHPKLQMDLKERINLCKDLEVLCTQDSTILEEVIDEYVYMLSNERLDEMQEFVNKELSTDY
jgi:hypothetical protein